MEMQISVRDFVEFLLRSGDITRRGERVKEDAMQEGARIHRLIQNRMGESYRAEVPIAHRIDCGEYTIKIEGRADGVISGEPLVIDEIKSTYRDLDKITEPIPVHLAQARCYAYFYAETYRQREMGVRLTYCNIETEQIKYFEQTNTREELENWFMTLMSEYKKWTDFSYEWRKKRNASIRKVEFPFPYRDGQKELVTQVYQTICHKRKLFIQAPTGVGKTLSTIFPAVKAVGEGKADKIFYLTAKTITGSVAANALGLLRENGLAYKSVVLMAREKICFMPEKDCDPETCPYAKGHFDRINDAVFDLLVQEERFDRDTITGYAQKHLVCPFEMGLDISLFSDLIICDYNYLFDPYA
ncbi:MAG: PD-(D/E)XK nuclease family protein, partial [Lachnospiraceae bacterium]|nr:PD-(D/E)XK nuclease family protein [Lachnospiraceae bacterium]